MISTLRDVFLHVLAYLFLASAYYEYSILQGIKMKDLVLLISLRMSDITSL